MSRSILLGLIGLNLAVGAYFVFGTGESDTQVETVQAADPVHGQSRPERVTVAAVTTIPEMPAAILSPTDELTADKDFTAQDHSDAAILNELDESLSSRQEFDVAQATLEQGAPRECRVWGPAPAAEEFAELMAALTESGGLPEIQEIDIQLPPDYLVFVQGLPSLSHARQTAAALRDMNIENFVIDQDDTGPGVSVGVFSRRPLAERQQEKVSGMGYDVAIKPMEKSQKAYNLVAHVTPESNHYSASISACLDIAHNP